MSAAIIAFPVQGVQAAGAKAPAPLPSPDRFDPFTTGHPPADFGETALRLHAGLRVALGNNRGRHLAIHTCGDATALALLGDLLSFVPAEYAETVRTDFVRWTNSPIPARKSRKPKRSHYEGGS